MNTQDIIYIHAIKVRTVIGILPHERAMKQTLIIDCELGTDTRAAGASDDIADALNYAAICDSITAFAASADYQLLEAFAEALAATLLLGDRSGGMISYWLVPEIMRLELNWLDYAQKIPRLLQTDFPPGIRNTILHAKLAGAALGALTAYTLYHTYQKRKKPCTENTTRQTSPKH